MLWLPALTLNLAAGSALARGYMRVAETTHFELMTMGIYMRALRCAIVPGQDRLQGDAEGGHRPRRPHALARCGRLCACAVLASGS